MQRVKVTARSLLKENFMEEEGRRWTIGRSAPLAKMRTCCQKWFVLIKVQTKPQHGTTFFLPSLPSALRFWVRRRRARRDRHLFDLTSSVAWLHSSVTSCLGRVSDAKSRAPLACTLHVPTWKRTTQASLWSHQ